MTADVVQLSPLNRIAERIRSAWQRTEHGRSEWIEGTLELAQALAEARERFPSNSVFGAWLGENELDWIGSHDRRSLISMAGNIELSRRILKETKSSSWQLIWKDEIEPRLASVSTTALSTQKEAPANAMPAETQKPAPQNSADPTSRVPEPPHGGQRSQPERWLLPIRPPQGTSTRPA